MNIDNRYEQTTVKTTSVCTFEEEKKEDESMLIASPKDGSLDDSNEGSLPNNVTSQESASDADHNNKNEDPESKHDSPLKSEQEPKTHPVESSLAASDPFQEELCPISPPLLYGPKSTKEGPDDFSAMFGDPEGATQQQQKESCPESLALELEGDNVDKNNKKNSEENNDIGTNCDAHCDPSTQAGDNKHHGNETTELLDAAAHALDEIKIKAESVEPKKEAQQPPKRADLSVDTDADAASLSNKKEENNGNWNGKDASTKQPEKKETAKKSPSAQTSSGALTPNRMFAERTSAAMKDFRAMWKLTPEQSSVKQTEKEHQVQQPRQEEKVKSTPTTAMEESSSKREEVAAEKSADTKQPQKDSTMTSFLDRMKASTPERKALTERQSSTEEKASTSSTNNTQAKKEDKAEEVEISETSSTSMGFLRGSSFLNNASGPDLAHKLKDHTFRSPTKCDICSGLLVGLFSQGLKCECCGMNVHHGQGKGEHDDCRAEALLMSCQGKNAKENDNKQDQPMKLREAIAEVRELAKKSPDFYKEVREQMDRDIKSHAKKYVVKSSAQEERSKKFRRLKDRVAPLVEQLDKIQNGGTSKTVGVLLYYHALFAAIVASLTILSFILALWPTQEGFSVQAVLIHSSTVLASLHATLLLLSLAVRKGSFAVQRKTNVWDQFLQDFFTIQAESDIGISLAGAASRARFWSDRFVLSSAITCCTAISFWYLFQAPLGSSPAQEEFTCPIMDDTQNDMEEPV